MAKENKLALRLLTPHAEAIELEADEVTLPGQLGELGILPGHLPLLSPLREGQVGVKEGKMTHRYAISEGMLEVLPDKVTVLVERAELVEDRLA